MLKNVSIDVLKNQLLNSYLSKTENNKIVNKII